MSEAPINHPVRILFLDVDGTLTDGVIGFTRDGDTRNFWVRDGLALEWARDLGVVPVAISGRASLAVAGRMADLGLEHYLGVKDKVEVAEQVRAREAARWDECAMVGDDLPDVPLLKRVGWPIAVAGASRELVSFVRTTTRARPGFGAVREVVEMILRHNGVWDRVLDRYEARPARSRSARPIRSPKARKPRKSRKPRRTR
jgi:3-deoxy-D-manno-octulosonate 8-phosphate phosphatase (KDO 8-P phosphatase)